MTIDPEFVVVLEQERERLREERRRIPKWKTTVGNRLRRAAINQRLVRIKELLAK